MKPGSIKVIDGTPKDTQSVKLPRVTYEKIEEYGRQLGAELGFELTMPQTVAYLMKRAQPLKIDLSDPVVPIPLSVSRDIRDEVLQIINDHGGRNFSTSPPLIRGKIDAIKHVRLRLGVGLKEAKEEVERIVEDAIQVGNL